MGVYFHDDPVYGLNVHPEQENVFLTACDNGKVQLWDARNTSAGILFIYNFYYMLSYVMFIVSLINIYHCDLNHHH